jgi:hypothetical protein
MLPWVISQAEEDECSNIPWHRDNEGAQDEQEPAKSKATAWKVDASHDTLPLRGYPIPDSLQITSTHLSPF